ncbi:hypothetical protein [Membranihabitans maritimus]|uniref:hypothetical protein n=1 Tax=Membranihabitans maritimus TaxID=2904244 RepID=UPI001F3E9065|nr:hypothetical protein [Membranihabitans maritimus]
MWKGIIEVLLPDFLAFFYSDQTFDLDKGYEFLDKELEEIYPFVGGQHQGRRVDKLVKVFDTTGNEQWLLIHIEVQSYRDENLPLRMFNYFYRIVDRYKTPVSTLVILADSNPRYYPAEYRYSVYGTNLLYSYPTYKVLDQSEEELVKNDNPFATVIQIVLTAFKLNKLTNIEQVDLKFSLVRKLYDKGYQPKTIRALMLFIRFYVKLGNNNMNLLFDKKVKHIVKNHETMGIEEMIIQEAKKRGVEQGIERKVLEATKKMVQEGFATTVICKVLDVTPDFVKRVKSKIQP